MKNLFAVLLISMASSVAAVCPNNVLIEKALDQNYKKLKSAKLQSEAQTIVGELWELWTKAPNDKAQQLLNSGMAIMRQGDLRKAEAELTKLINYCLLYTSDAADE